MSFPTYTYVYSTHGNAKVVHRIKQHPYDFDFTKTMCNGVFYHRAYDTVVRTNILPDMKLCKTCFERELQC